MKRVFALLLILLAFGIYWVTQTKPTLITPVGSSPFSRTVTPKLVAQNQSTSLFVPYWTLGADAVGESYDTVIYFGITPGENGVNTEEQGYKKLADFQEKTTGKRTYLTLRMTDTEQNFRYLKNTALQDTLISKTVQTAQQFGFQGIVLDLEVSALPFDSVLKQISSFNTRLSSAAQKADLHYAVTLYGDTFFRIRPFDVKQIASHADEVMIMAYDFHKSRGNPGPNFPLKGKEKYGYDYSELITHFSNAVPKEKLTVIFGYFGYDWTVNKEQNMLTHGVPVTLNQIRERYLSSCQLTNCTNKRDANSAESVVSYTDNDGLSHLVWYEDQESVSKKEAFLKQQGITSYSYWAYSYF